MDNITIEIPAHILAQIPVPAGVVLPVRNNPQKVVAPTGAPPSIPAPTIKRNWQDYIQPVNDLSCTGERICATIAKLLFSTQRDELTYFLEHGGRFPVHQKYIPKLLPIIQAIGNLQYGQKFTIEID